MGEISVINAANNAINKAWEYSITTGVLIFIDVFLCFVVLVFLKIIIWDKKSEDKRQDKDTDSRIALAEALQKLTILSHELATAIRSIKCTKD